MFALYRTSPCHVSTQFRLICESNEVFINHKVKDEGEHRKCVQLERKSQLFVVSALQAKIARQSALHMLLLCGKHTQIIRNSYIMTIKVCLIYNCMYLTLCSIFVQSAFNNTVCKVLFLYCLAPMQFKLQPVSKHVLFSHYFLNTGIIMNLLALTWSDMKLLNFFIVFTRSNMLICQSKSLFQTMIVLSTRVVFLKNTLI